MKTGSRVVIRRNISKASASRYGLNKDMLCFRGKEAIVVSVFDSRVFLDIDNGAWTWHQSDFEIPKEKRRV